eukprot:m.286613 g.286613  ORF g.286613 m.286613 type:complete len:56 (+) comp15780_c4_seq15:4325-4492(+)
MRRTFTIQQATFVSPTQPTLPLCNRSKRPHRSQSMSKATVTLGHCSVVCGFDTID